MNDKPRFPGVLGPVEPFLNPLDAILADLAISVQLPAGLHARTGDRYEAIRKHIECPGSPLYGRVLCFYPQGSMAIDATISTRGTDNEYDLDVVVELDVSEDTSPEEVLDLLESAVADYPVQAVERQSRCITLRYADNMHVDLTPSRRLATLKDRESVIFHAKHGDPTHLHRPVMMNAWAFGRWYNARTPMEERFALAYNKRLYEADGIEFAADADVHLVPAQTPLIVKNTATVALQLIKRFRNVLYASTTGRIPPSVMLSCHAGKAALPGMLLSDMVIRQARWTERAIEEASRQGQLLDVRNPEWDEDRFTDRWPENKMQQDAFAAALRDLADGLEAIKQGNVQLEDLQDWLRNRFGDRVVSNTLKTFNDRTGRAIRSLDQSYTRKGGLFVPAVPAVVGSIAVASPVAARSHTNMGERR
ncbi:nucleotidyltransferase [Mesorhizobium sp. VK25A]|uniref:Cyclic GMP-AMP synthase n=2 Tax=Mesorhizobium TaxID=68287 RepID=A0ABU5ADH6_9HYPH|nr:MULTISPECIES: nucleotidyltransferase [unclassified Mesorhizobium]MDX8469783.1 nucleotidyltransferase [Mesorhizobium sp. VK23B]MDX8476122.1 nucleotidyltransferase [Mesorhizobium sp. VK23A]MDX8508375.1 nucleotidyltransferase [Mesorhizobium sp. VK22E]MDX8535326.1 nucleotidyltransferase [Mesorhizobium sp. VK25D]MDX8546826.1 nucleotidyltransferase [Mesorhizobium sp. VK25A]